MCKVWSIVAATSLFRTVSAWLEERGLQRLVDMSKHPLIGQHILEVVFGPERFKKDHVPLAPFAFRFNLSSVLEDKKPFPKDAASAPKTRSFVIYTYDDRPPNDESQDQDRDEIVTDMEAGRYGFAKWVEPRRIGARIQTYRR